jgi:hypothetical protein
MNPRKRLPALKKNIEQLVANHRVAARPEPGLFKLRLVRRGPWLPARIWWCDHEPGEPDNLLDTGPILVAEIAGQAADPLEVWEHGQRIEQVEYNHRLKVVVWATMHAPQEPEAKPNERVDLRKHPPLF